jgi:hypothetical protein
MSDKSSDNSLGFLLLVTILLAFTFGVEVGQSLQKHRHCRALEKASPPTHASSCRE